MKYPKVMFLFVGDCSANITHALKLDTKIDLKSDFFLFFSDNYLYGEFKHFDTPKKLLMSINKINEGCCICLSSVEEEDRRRVICMTCFCRCCDECVKQLNSTKCPLCRTIIGKEIRLRLV